MNIRKLILLITAILLIYSNLIAKTYPLQSKAKANSGFQYKEKLPADTLAKKLVNELLTALNSDDRKVMADFVALRCSQNLLQRIPLNIAVSLTRGYYYETGGLGYNLIRILPVEPNLVKAELFNRLTEAKVLLKIPVSADAVTTITGPVEIKVIEPKAGEKQGNNLTDREIINRIEQCLNKLKADEEFSGAVVLAKNENVLIKECIGFANRNFEVPNAADTKFNLASVGKIFTGLAITQLVEKGLLSFDDTISKFVPADWLNPAVSRKIQIKHLLTHTSGLGDYFKEINKQCNILFFKDLNDYKSLIDNDTLAFKPGTRFSYSNTGMLLLGVVIENVTHQKYYDYLRNNIFIPVGMANTDAFDKDKAVKNLATGYTKRYENGEIFWDNHQSNRILRGSPSGGLYSTIDDMLKFDDAIRSNKLLSPESSEVLFTGRPELNASFHSYGFFVSEGVAGRVASHQGDGSGVNCQFKMYLDSGYTVIVLSNYSLPSANIVTNVIDQLIVNKSSIK